MTHTAQLMLGQVVAILGLGSIIISLFFTKERYPGTIVINAINIFVTVGLWILILKGLWLVAVHPW